MKPLGRTLPAVAISEGTMRRCSHVAVCESLLLSVAKVSERSARPSKHGLEWSLHFQKCDFWS